MASKEPLVRFYDLSGPKPWSPACWYTRYALNYKQIPYTVTKLSYPAIRPKCEELFPDMTGLDATVPIIEILQPPYEALNDSTPIANLLNERFTEKDGYKNLRDVEKLDDYRKSLQGGIGWPIIVWIMYDVWNNALDPNDGSKEFFRRTREENMGVKLENFTKEKIGTEEQVLEEIKKRWKPLQERMKNDDGTGDRMPCPTSCIDPVANKPEANYIDFYDASNVRWLEAASHEKYQKLLKIYSDDTFIKLMKKVEKYES